MAAATPPPTRPRSDRRRLPAARGSMTPAVPWPALAAMAAVLMDAGRLDALLFLDRCAAGASGLFQPVDLLWQHTLAYPWTTLVMLFVCLDGRAGATRASVERVAARLAVMTCTMPGVCWLAGAVTSAIAAPATAAALFAATMLAGMASIHAAVAHSVAVLGRPRRYTIPVR